MTTLEAAQAAMHTSEARIAFLAALVTRLYSEDQLRLPRAARIDDVGGLVALDGMVAALTTEQVRSAITALIDENPPFVEASAHAELRRVLRLGRPEPVRVSRAQGRAQDSGEFLVAGRRLNPGDKLTSANGRYTLAMQPDGNLVGYDGTKAFWDTGTWGRPGCYLVAEPNGRFTVMTPEGTVAWSQASGSPHAFLCIQDDRNIVIYFNDATPAAAWASHTNI
ncbi:hypothetical protein M1L60_27820 [Actinoplanes sp. TRM 88003]|uniref:Bulb-type lectin domain-containing protein n=1 Tax=Paractinoplanes aksuensis TaxID=2939490 RepID=A0ABT1DU83_9ACTN|nr:hypothetical protein [Actinoplanes aksuensis]MCO8274413.1 hypothetical protein [Actinoplanes aksuensis]